MASPFEDDQEATLPDRKIKAAMAFLQEALAIGPQPARDVEEEAKKHGHAHSTLVHARKRLGIRSERIATMWIWSTPAQRKQPVKPQEAN